MALLAQCWKWIQQYTLMVLVSSRAPSDYGRITNLFTRHSSPLSPPLGFGPSTRTTGKERDGRTGPRASPAHFVLAIESRDSFPIGGRTIAICNPHSVGWLMRSHKIYISFVNSSEGVYRIGLLHLYNVSNYYILDYIT